MAHGMGEIDYLSVSGDISRQLALRSLLMPGDPCPELVVLASGVTGVDVVTGTATRLRIARQMRRHPGGQVTIMPPSAAGVSEQYLELLMPLPDAVAVNGQLPAGPARFGLVPATSIADEEAAVAAAAFSLDACEVARVSQPRANLVALAVAELASNALRHSVASPDAPVVAATIRGRGRNLEVAVTDLGEGISESGDAAALLRAIPGAGGGLAHIVRQGQRHGVDVTVEVLAGTARLRWGWSSHRTEQLAYMPGTTLVVRIPS